MAKKAFFVGIKGVGMTALALAMQESGWQVAGSDTTEVFITDHILSEQSLGVRPLGSALPSDLDLVVYSGAYPPPQTSIQTLPLAEALAELVKDRSVIAVAGVGGKTTTSAMLATMFKNAGRDVGYYIGTSDVIGLSKPGSAGSDSIFIVEADEYAISKTDKRPKFTLLNPHIFITTNIKYDHPDIYKNESSTLAVFREYIERLRESATWIACEDDPLTRKLLATTSHLCQVVTYSKNNSLIDKLDLSVFGDHNKLNAVAAVLAGIQSGLPESAAITGIKSYQGSKRRQEKIGQVAGRLLYDDYAHHPHEIKATISAFKKEFPSNRIVVVFESHTYSRTEALLSQFAKTLALADHIYLMPIFESAREKGQPHTVTPASFESAVKKHNPQVKALTWDDAEAIIAKETKPGDLILTMGAGFVYKLHEKIICILKNK